MRNLSGLLALLCLVVLVGSPGETSRAQEAATTRRVEVRQVWFPEELGSNLSGRGGWLPVYVELECLSNEAETVLLESTVFVDRKPAFRSRQWVDVAPGAPRRAWSYLMGFPEELQQRATFEVRTPGGQTIRRGDEWFLSSHSYQSAILSVLVVGQQLAGVTPWPNGTTFSTGRREQKAAWVAEAAGANRLPDSVLGYQGVSLVVLRDLEGERMEPRQVDALRSWVFLGGVVVVQSSTKSGEVFRSEIVRVLVGDRLVEPESETCQPRHLWIQEPTTGRQVPGLLSAPFSPEEGLETPELTLLDPIGDKADLEIHGTSTVDLENTEEKKRLYAEVPYGQGRVGFVTFAGEAPRAENVEFLRAFWGRVIGGLLGHAERSTFSRQAARMVMPELERDLNDPSRDVGFLSFVGLVAGYLMLVGPGLYFVLKWRRRLPAVLWVEPVLIVAYLGVIFAVAYVNKGVLTKRRVWTFISQREGESLALRESYLTVFSATDAVYRVEAPRGFLLRPVFRNKEQQIPVSLSRKRSGGVADEPALSGLSLDGFRLAQWEQGHLINLDVLDWEGQGVLLEDVLPAGESADPGVTPAVRVTNRLPHTVRQGVIYHRTGRYPVPRLEPGEQAVVVLDEPDAPGQAEEEDPWLRLLDASKAFRNTGFGYPTGLNVRFAANLERDDDDFRLDLRSSLREKIDLYLLFQ